MRGFLFLSTLNFARTLINVVFWQELKYIYLCNMLMTFNC
jgi:hypothetical protein